MAKHFAIFNENGRPKIFYADDINDNIPPEAIEITNEQWQALLSSGDAYWDGNDVIVPPKGDLA